MSKHIALGDYVKWTGTRHVRDRGSIGKVIHRANASDILEIKWQNGEKSNTWLKNLSKVEVEELI